MRYINLNNIVLPVGWTEKVQALNDQLNAAATPEQRKKIIEQNPIWKELFISLSALSNGKCWYSEALDVMSDRDIDHFRPKNEAKNAAGDDLGYLYR